MFQAPCRLSPITWAVAIVQAAVLIFAVQVTDALAVPTGGPAEYAFRWSAAQDKGPRTIEAAAQLLAINDKKPSVYRVQYAEVPRPPGLPDGVRVIARQRTELTGKDPGKVESSYKLRAASALTALAPESRFPCLLKSATWESELDVGWGPASGGFGPQPTVVVLPPVATEVHARTCSTAATLEAALLPPILLSRPLSDQCAAEMTRYKDGKMNLKLEQWRMPSGEAVLEVSRKVGKDTAQARRQFQSEVVSRLVAQGVLATRESKTELGSCP